MVVIRLARQGRTKYPVYRIVAADSRRAATSKFVAVIGHYNPHTKELVVKHDDAKRFLANGAQPSNSVIKLFIKEGIELPAWATLKTKAPKPKEEEAKADSIEVTPEEAAAESDAEDGAGEADVEAAAELGERVAAVATEEASAAEDMAQPIDHTETAADNEQAADQAEKAEEIAAEAAQGGAEASAESDAA